MLKVNEIFHYGQVVMLYTHTVNGGLHGRDMTIFLRPQDEDLMWFATSRHSRKVKELEKSTDVVLSYKDPYRREKVVLMGTAALVDDLAIKKELWRQQWAMFWPEGVESEDLLLLKITLKRG